MLALAHTLLTEGLHDPAFLDRYTVRLRSLRQVPRRQRGRRAEERRMGRGHLRGRGRAHPGSGTPDGRRAHARHRHLVPAAHPARRAAGLGGHRARRDARADRAARRRLRARIRLDGRRRRPRPHGAAALPVAGSEPGTHVHPRGPDRRHAAQPRRRIRLRRQAADIPGHPARLLGRRQSVPPPSGPRPAAPRLRPAGHDRRARAVLDGQRAAGRLRPAGHHDARARGHRRRTTRHAPDRDASGRRPDRRGPRRLRDLRRAGRQARLRGAVHRGPHAARMAHAPLRGVARRAASRLSGLRDFWAAGELELPSGPERFTLFEQFRADPEAAPLHTPSGKIEIYSPTVAGFGYDGLPRPSRLAGAGRVARCSPPPGASR
jgi:hypothetical protein